MTQESFIRAWQKLESFEGRSLFSSWLHRLAVNVVLNERRPRAGLNSLEPLDDHPSLREIPAPRRPPGHGGDLESAIAALPEAARCVFVLHEIYGYTHEEISEIAGMAEGTSKAHLHRARTLLREALTS
jgi:RNA polymerase sigma-70 factor (ECF subfamily)